MPMPHKGEKHDDWTSRCMGDAEEMKTNPDEKQRYAVCETKWEQHQKASAMKQLIINVKNDVAEVLVYDQIGVDPFFGDGISAAEFRKQVKGIKASTMNLRINSPGGSVTDGAAMMQALEEFPGRIEVDIDGIAASAASVLAMAGDVIRIPSNALMMIHEATAGLLGRADDMRRMADLLDKVNGQLLDSYMRRAKVDRKKMSALMSAETWLTGQEAVDLGLADTVSGNHSIAASFDLSKFGYKHVPQIAAVAASLQQKREEFNRLMSGATAIIAKAQPEKPTAQSNPFGPIQVGDMVQWLTEDPDEMCAEMECGIVEEIATSGTLTIPGTSLSMDGTASNPAVRVCDDDGDCWYLVGMNSLQKAVMPMEGGMMGNFRTPAGDRVG